MMSEGWYLVVWIRIRSCELYEDKGLKMSEASFPPNQFLLKMKIIWNFVSSSEPQVSHLVRFHLLWPDITQEQRQTKRDYHGSNTRLSSSLVWSNWSDTIVEKQSQSPLLWIQNPCFLLHWRRPCFFHKQHIFSVITTNKWRLENKNLA